MTLQEFKAWFDGFTEGMDKTPNNKQWDRIKKRVKEIDGTAVTERVFVDRYWSHPRPYYPYWGYISGSGIGTTTGGSLYSGNSNAQVYQSQLKNYQQASNFNSGSAMLALGRAEASEMTQ